MLIQSVTATTVSNQKKRTHPDLPLNVFVRKGSNEGTVTIKIKGEDDAYHGYAETTVSGTDTFKQIYMPAFAEFEVEVAGYLSPVDVEVR